MNHPETHFQDDEGIFPDQDLIAEAVEYAKRRAHIFKLKVGQSVEHPTEHIAYTLLRVEGEKAVVGLDASRTTTGVAIEKTFPLDELYDPAVVNDYLHEAQGKKDTPMAA